MTVNKWRKSQVKNGTHATIAERSLKSTLRAINDIYIIEEDPVETVYDTGLKAEVTDAIKEGKLFIPEAYKDFAEKFPCRGKIVSVGDKCKAGLKIGERVMYARLGVQRFQENDKHYCVVREADLHAVIS